MNTTVEPIKISDSEWEVMRVIWTLDAVTAQEISNILAESMDWKPATVKTLLGRLVKKRLFGRNRKGKNLFTIHLFQKQLPSEVLLKIYSRISVQKK